jgi:D-arabinose 1-dehydrogenase-like Zn-dependent alcohol dehydrogenase
MKAAVVHSFDKPLVTEDVPKPKADWGEVVVKIEACGLSHSDIHAAQGDWPFKPNLSLIPVHKAVGVVESVGNGVKEVKEGDRVAIRKRPKYWGLSGDVCATDRCTRLSEHALELEAVNETNKIRGIPLPGRP